jgi:excisionase family DNA binding protein
MTELDEGQLQDFEQKLFHALANAFALPRIDQLPTGPVLAVFEEGEGSLLAQVSLLRAPSVADAEAVSREWLTGGVNPAGRTTPGASAGTSPIRKRRARERPKTEFLRTEEVARILPVSKRKVQAMAARGDLPAWKLPHCNVWMFDETAIRALVAAAKPAKPETSCRHSPPLNTIPTTTYSSAAKSTTSATSSEDNDTSSRLTRLMSARRGRSATKS